MVSSTNVEAVAANNVALQHYGQKVVYGHVTTNSGRQVLVQITFDVMSVRKKKRICALKIHSGTRRQNTIPTFARNSICVTFVHVW